MAKDDDVQSRFEATFASVLMACGSEATWTEMADALWREAEALGARIGPDRAVADRLRTAAVYVGEDCRS